MNGAAAQKVVKIEASDLFGRIGAFLANHRLSPDPAHYAFVHRVLLQPDSLLARSVAELTDGGVRLTAKDIVTLGGTVASGTPVDDDGSSDDDLSEHWATEASGQVESLTAVIRTMRDEATDFGRDLARSAEAIGQMPPDDAGESIARITAAMIARVKQAEGKLNAATEEANELRAKLADARETARRDPLTKLPNRRAFEEAFAAATTVRRCVAVFDIDRFKRINDAYGHAVGDRVLTAIGATLAEMCDGHLVARHGGEEFTVLMTGIGLEAATRIIEDARVAVAAKRYRSRQTDEPLGEITISGGVTCVAATDDCEAAFARADRLLYAAKARGRNIVIAG